MVAEVYEIGIGELHLLKGAGIAGFTEMHQPARILKRQSTEQGRVNHGEDRGVGADAQRQRQHRNHGEAGRFAQLAQRVTKFMQKRLHSLTPPAVPASAPATTPGVRATTSPTELRQTTPG